MIYLDNAATTKLDDEVLKIMMPYLQDEYGNPGGVYNLGSAAKRAIDDARNDVSNFIGANPENIIFTSGGSEANSLALLGIAPYLEKIGKTHIVVSAIEHHSVMKAVEVLSNRGFTYTIIDPSEYGGILSYKVEGAIREDTGVVCVMYVNNETGIINDSIEIGNVCNRKNVLYMVDCVQAAGSIKIDVNELKCNFASISAHKIHGPKGIGALYTNCIDIMTPLICGGNNQEYGMRGGTENVPAIVGFGAACNAAYDDDGLDSNLIMLYKKMVFMKELKNNLLKVNIVPELHGPISMAIGKVASVRIPGIDAETLLMLMNSKGVCASAGSACNSSEHIPSHVLKAIGLSDRDSRETIRISFSKMTSESDVIEAAFIISECVQDIVSMFPGDQHE